MRLTFIIICLFFVSFNTFANDNEQTRRRKRFTNKHQGLSFGLIAGKYIYGDIAFYKTKYLLLTTVKQSYGLEFSRFDNRLIIAPKASIHFRFFKKIQVGGQALFYYDFNQVAPAVRAEVGYVINKHFETRAAIYYYIWNNDLTAHLNKFHISLSYFLKLK